MSAHRCSHCGRQLWTFRDGFQACGHCDLMAPYDWATDPEYDDSGTR